MVQSPSTPRSFMVYVLSTGSILNYRVRKTWSLKTCSLQCPFYGAGKECREFMDFFFSFLTLLMGFLLYHKLLFTGNKKLQICVF